MIRQVCAAMQHGSIVTRENIRSQLGPLFQSGAYGPTSQLPKFLHCPLFYQPYGSYISSRLSAVARYNASISYADIIKHTTLNQFSLKTNLCETISLLLIFKIAQTTH